MKRDAIDLGTVKVFTLFKKYFIPTLFGMLSMSAVTAIDGIFVGHGIGSDGIAAINICIPLLMLFTGVGLMVGAGSSVVASIQLSRGKPKAARINVTQAILFVTVVALIPSALMMAYPSATARLLGASEHLAPMVREYLLWFIPSLMFQMWCSVCLFIIRLDGVPRLAMMYNVAAALISVLLGWLFIFPLGWGLMGAAFAATIGLLAGGLIGLVYLFRFARKLRFYPIKWSVKSMRLSFRNLGYQCRIGSSALLTEATLATLMFVGNQVFMVGNAIAQSAQPIICYNFGLGYPYFSAAFIFFILNLTVIGYYQSVERVKPATVLALLRGFVFLIPSFILLPQAIGTNGIWLALCLSEMLTTVVIVVMYSRAARKACLPQRTE